LEEVRHGEGDLFADARGLELDLEVTDLSLEGSELGFVLGRFVPRSSRGLGGEAFEGALEDLSAELVEASFLDAEGGTGFIDGAKTSEGFEDDLQALLGLGIAVEMADQLGPERWPTACHAAPHFLRERV
jgi:hypothetical protein